MRRDTPSEGFWRPWPLVAKGFTGNALELCVDALAEVQNLHKQPVLVQLRD